MTSDWERPCPAATCRQLPLDLDGSAGSVENTSLELASHKFGKCLWAYLETLPRRHGDGWCEVPVRLHCVSCDEVMVARCKATRDDRCKPCAKRHRRGIARVLRSGIITGDGPRPDRPDGCFFVTITAPGADVLPWDQEACGHLPGQCSGPAGCRVERLAGAVWNGSAPQRWSWFVTELRRQLKRDVQYCGSWETQERGVLHRHFLMWSPGLSERRAKAAVRLCAHRWGFGSQYDVQSISRGRADEVARKAGYVAAYATKGSDLAVTLDVASGELREGAYRRWSASRSWGMTMRRVRVERMAWARLNAAPAPGAAPPPGGGAGAEGALDLYTESYATGQLPLPEGVGL